MLKQLDYSPSISMRDRNLELIILLFIRVQWPEVIHIMATFSSFPNVPRKTSKCYWIVDSRFGFINYHLLWFTTKFYPILIGLNWHS